MAGKNILCSTKEDIWMAVRRRGNQIAANMTDQEFFDNDAFRNYAGKLAEFILRNGKRKHRLSMKYQPADKAVAYTDGEMIYLNTGNHIAANPKLLERRFRVNMGILFHECAHKLFLDFTVTKKAITGIRNGSLYGKVETYGDPALDDAKAELEKLLSQGYQESVARLFGHLCNILDDGHDEAASATRS